jgi:hypothetical protein
MSSHREAPEISKDPVADNTDVYAFVSPDNPETVTIITNYIPLQGPAGGPNFYEFGNDVLYSINIDNDGDGEEEVSYQFQFSTQVLDPNTFLYNTGPISSLSDPHWNRPQTYSVTKVVNGQSTVLATGLACPPCNVGPRSTPDYSALADAAVHRLSSGEIVFAGQRAESFYVDLGSIFDLGTLRPFEHLHLIPSADAVGVNATKAVNVSTIAIQVPKTALTSDNSNPTDPMSAKSVVGIYGSASRQKARMIDPATGQVSGVGPWVQVSRQAAPLFNEVLVPMAKKDLWNALSPSQDSQFAQGVAHPELAGLLPVLYPGVFPNLAGLTAARADLLAILLTGIPSGVVAGFQNYTGAVQADLLRLNMAIPPAASPNVLGLVGGDPAGFPNGRRLIDDVVTVELRAIAGATYPLVAPSYKPDGAAALITDGLTGSSVPAGFLSTFPYLGVPYDGYDTQSS